MLDPLFSFKLMAVISGFLLTWGLWDILSSKSNATLGTISRQMRGFGLIILANIIMLIAVQLSGASMRVLM